MTKQAVFSPAKQSCSAVCLMCASLFLVFFLASLSLAQGPDTLWTRTYGGSENDYAYDIQQTSDGGYIIAGYTYSFGSGGAYLIKLNSEGDTLWTRVYEEYEQVEFFDAQAVIQTADGGYILTGIGFDPSFVPYLLKTNSFGDILWVKGYEEIYGDPWGGVAVCHTSDGGYIIAADGGSDMWPDISLIKTNDVGDTLWTHSYGMGWADRAGGVQQTEDGGYIFGGSTEPFEGTLDFYLIKMDENGDSVWTRTYGGTDDERGNALDQTLDGGYIIAGGIERLDSSDDMYVVKTDSLGDIVWIRLYGGPEVDDAYKIEQIDDGGYAIFGHTLSYGAGWADLYLVRTDSHGDTLWTRTYGGPNTDFGLSFQQTSDGGYVMAGWTLSFGTGRWDIYVVKTGPDLSVASKPFFLPNTIALYQNYPNPFNATTQIAFDLPMAGPVTLKVFDLLGREVAMLVDEMHAPGHHSVLFDGSNLPSGIYFYRIETGNLHEAKKMVLLK